MKDVTAGNFGLLVAYLLPGFVSLLAVAAYSETVQGWLATGASSSPTVGGFLYLTLASLTAGLLVSTIRWALVDPLHHATGVRPSDWNFGSLKDRLPAFEMLVESHYRYYQFYANMLVAVILAYGAWRETCCTSWRGWDAAFLVIAAMLFLGLRDTLRKYYRRVGQLAT